MWCAAVQDVARVRRVLPCLRRVQQACLELHNPRPQVLRHSLPARSMSDQAPGKKEGTDIYLKKAGTYKADEKHSANILEAGALGNRISNFSHKGFVINDKRIYGSAALLPGLSLKWGVRSMEEMTPESLSLFCKFQPSLKILVLGCGDTIQQVDPAVHAYLRANGVSLEVQDTRRACATYNFLSEEGRLVAGAMITPTEDGYRAMKNR